MDLEGSATEEIDAPVQACFAAAADVEHAPEWQGSMRSARVLERDADGRAALVEAELDASVTTVRLTLRFAYDEPHAVRWTREGGDLRALEGSWRLEELDAGRTRATYALQIGLNRRLALVAKGARGPVEARVRELLTRRPVEGLRRVVEGRG